MPELSWDEREALLAQNFESVGCAISRRAWPGSRPDLADAPPDEGGREEHVINATEKRQGCRCSPATSSDPGAHRPPLRPWCALGSAAPSPQHQSGAGARPVPRSLRLQQIPCGPDGREGDDHGAAQRRRPLVCTDHDYGSHAASSCPTSRWSRPPPSGVPPPWPG